MIKHSIIGSVNHEFRSFVIPIQKLDEMWFFCMIISKRLPLASSYYLLISGVSFSFWCLFFFDRWRWRYGQERILTSSSSPKEKNNAVAEEHRKCEALMNLVTYHGHSFSKCYTTLMKKRKIFFVKRFTMMLFNTY